MQCVAVCCSVLQYVAVSIAMSVAVSVANVKDVVPKSLVACCSALQCVAKRTYSVNLSRDFSDI